MKRMLVILTLVPSTIAAGATSSAPPSPLKAGLLSQASGRSYLYTTEASIAPGQHLRLQYPDRSGSAACCISVGADMLGRPEIAEQPVIGALTSQPIYRYAINLSGQAAYKGNFVGAAIWNARGVSKAKQSRSTSLQAVDQAGATHHIEACLGTEGLNLLVFSGKQRETWLYTAFGYNVDPSLETCDPHVFEEP
ncbi:hypothetical protein AB4Z48_38440 [Cupriavidus sp. 2TAF22]|uniref:hypothetical protein n=1 Tax=unclassified Cupriavidus TaxID=2640874 RepID=UPI003F8F21B6